LERIAGAQGGIVQIIVTRRWQAPDNAEYRATTTGVVSIDGEQVCFSLEPTALMILAGTYPIKLRWSPRFGRLTPHLEVPGRSEIEMHGLNFATESEGCIGVAEHRISDYEIAEAEPATSSIENSLQQAEANSETNTISVLDDF
jgi:hypothetical protein